METMDIFNRFWIPYSTQNPSAKRINELFTQEGEQVVHDHIALRTFNDPRMDIDQIARIFTQHGYEARGEYEFKAKKVFGRHFEHTSDPHVPKVFISHLLLDQFDGFLKETITSLLDTVPDPVYQDPEIVYQGSIWGKIPFETYNKLRQESEYAAWLLVYGFRANHFAIDINKLTHFNSLQDVNAFVKSRGYIMNNSSGSEIYGAPEELLEQSATKSEILPFEFADGVYDIPSCFYEFTRRYKDANGHYYQGFNAANADKIFESTNYYKKQQAM
ncbi:MAG: DUF1338 domain-containing protein [Bacteroidales bacterium]